MPTIRPVSDLRNYNDVLSQIAIDSPVFLTKNGKGRCAIMDIEEYEKNRATLKLLSELAKAEKSADELGWLSEEEADKLIDSL